MKPTEIKCHGKTELNDGTGLSRREFFRDAGRMLLLAGLAGAAAKILAGHQAAAPGRDCWNGTACGGCPERPDCRQLGAVKFKANRNMKRET